MRALSQASFRDPSGQVVMVDDRVLRVVRPDGRADLDAFLSSPKARPLADAGLLVGTRVLEGRDRDAVLADGALAPLVDGPATLLLEHDRVPFASYPYEWSPEMLHAAGRLTLDLAEALLDVGMGLKDATPYNVLFHGPRPVFVDLLSFERREPGDATWLPYAQFVRTFVLPLLVHRDFGVPLHEIFAAHRDGLEPEQVYALAGPLRRLSPAYLGSVSLPTWLGRKKGQGNDQLEVYRKRPPVDPEKARFILGMMFRGLRKALDRAAPASARRSTWSEYMATFTYDDASFAAKEAFVKAVVEEARPRTALDVGCNTGHFSAIAARGGARVLALDYDATVVGLTWQRARAEKLDILPLRVDLTRPSPGLGWRNRECPPFLQRAAGGFDVALFLAVVHHMLVTERVPLAEIVELVADLGRDVVLEYVPPSDPMFRKLARGRDALYGWLDENSFEAACRARFDVVRRQPLDTGRVLFHLRRR